MKPANTTYTYAQLVKRSTTQLIAIYNRIFNTNVWEELFNPYEHRMELLLALWAEMQAAKVLAEWNAQGYEVEPYKALKITISPDGMAIVWNTGMVSGNRRITDQQMSIIRELAAQGETMRWIADAMNMSLKMVFNVLSGDYAITANRWNVCADAPDQIKPKRKVQTFKAKKVKADYNLGAAARPNHEFWTNLGL
jgi:hypothetical protein